MTPSASRSRPMGKFWSIRQLHTLTSRIHASSTHKGFCNSFAQVGRPTGRYHQLKPPTPTGRRHLHSHIDLEQSGHCPRMESCFHNGKYHGAQCQRGKLPTCDALGGSLPPDMPHNNSPSRCMQHSTYTLSHLRSKIHRVALPTPCKQSNCAVM